MADHKYRLIYFDGRGRAEVTRYLFALAGVHFEDTRFDMATWPEIKPTTPTGQVPVLEVDGKAYCQSLAIHRFVARQFGFYGKDTLEGLLIDQIVGVLADVLDEAIKIEWSLPDGDEKTTALEKFKSQTVPKLTKFLDSQLGTNKWFLGEQVSLADAAAYELLSNDVQKLAGNAWQEQWPSLKAHADNFTSLPAVAKYLAGRPATPF